MKYLLLFSFVSWLIYIVTCIVLFGFLTSVSNSYFALEKKSLKYKVWFKIFIFTIATPIIIIGVYLSAWFIYFAGAFLLLVGLTGALEGDDDKRVHNIGALIPIIALNIYFAMNVSIWYAIVSVVITAALYFIPYRNNTLWAEYFAFVSAFVGLGLWLNKIGLI